ncbi:hypothetical protein PPL_09373 [Heterostelium album PN500]|uniref:Uncharacterized protein n=1 Tax=Heterostelium pallidum (strain ATCC 26659 / Pp 5 / PN500) TaxID=670386 RepID=D3BLD9_HETP5|nr:hypothetical protein PPL_09373 [Heterostelium album PN500]EFA77873.1 hypothetical protein PPL_09373 [Heterostelium album PN500]|eukprot:XP_020430001.1 hypothetical protein PPL_09373 [Heterostelium album PN500]
MKQFAILLMLALLGMLLTFASANNCDRCYQLADDVFNQCRSGGHDYRTCIGLYNSYISTLFRSVPFNIYSNMNQQKDLKDLLAKFFNDDLQFSFLQSIRHSARDRPMSESLKNIVSGLKIHFKNKESSNNNDEHIDNDQQKLIYLHNTANIYFGNELIDHFKRYIVDYLKPARHAEPNLDLINFDSALFDDTCLDILESLCKEDDLKEVYSIYFQLCVTKGDDLGYERLDRLYQETNISKIERFCLQIINDKESIFLSDENRFFLITMVIMHNPKRISDLHQHHQLVFENVFTCSSLLFTITANNLTLFEKYFEVNEKNTTFISDMVKDGKLHSTHKYGQFDLFFPMYHRFLQSEAEEIYEKYLDDLDMVSRYFLLSMLPATYMERPETIQYIKDHITFSNLNSLVFISLYVQKQIDIPNDIRHISIWDDYRQSDIDDIFNIKEVVIQSVISLYQINQNSMLIFILFNLLNDYRSSDFMVQTIRPYKHLLDRLQDKDNVDINVDKFPLWVEVTEYINQEQRLKLLKFFWSKGFSIEQMETVD